VYVSAESRSCYRETRLKSDLFNKAASQTCLPVYPYKKGETYNVVFKINNGKDGIRNYRVLFKVNSDGAVQQLK